MRQRKFEASNAVIGPMPLAPLLMAAHTGSVPIPTEVTNPTPVTTTRRFKRGPLRLLLRLDVVDGVLYGLDLLGVLIGDVEVERLLERHHKLDDIERVCAEVIDETGCGVDLGLIHAELLDDDL